MSRPLICMTLTGLTLEENLQLIKKYAGQIDLVELRADCLNEDEQLHIRRFPSMVNLPCILSIRRDCDGGQFTSGEFSRTNLFARALSFANPERERNFTYVEFEEDYYTSGIQDAAMAFGIKIIRSLYSLEGPVHNLRLRCDMMRRTKYEIPKIMFRPKNLAEIAALFSEGSGLTEEHILHAVGPLSFPSHLLASLSGSLLTYVSPWESSAQNSLGFPDPATIEDTYRFRTISKTTDLYGIIGNPPIDRPIAPQLFQRGFSENAVDAVYCPLRSNSVEDALQFAEKTGLKGLSVTIPFKEDVLPYLYEVSPEVAQIGACNTVIRKNSRWIGHNTNAYAFERALLEFLGEYKIARKKVAIIGAGGIAHAVAYTIKHLGGRACIFNRTELPARQIAERYGFRYCSLEPGNMGVLDEYSNLIVQTTPVGMDGNAEHNDPLYFYDFRGNELLFDVIYTTSVTPVMQRASLAGCRVTNGYRMMEHQVLAQFKFFTGKDLAHSQNRGGGDKSILRHN